MNIKEKIYQMFILGFEGSELNSQNINIQNALKNGLGGVIFFAENFNKRDNFKNLVKNVNQIARILPFMSIDQEGGLVERTIKLDEKIEYLTPMALSSTNCFESVKTHYEILAQDLVNLGMNINYAPVLDVNTNPQNPVIGIRSFGENADEVIKYSQICSEVLNNHNILAVGKHFPGHGEACVDSHLDMPQIDISFDELETKHLKPFINSIQNEISAIMVAHVHYPAFDNEIIPASLSKNVITGYLKENLGFTGLIISDDMVMGGITKHYDKLDACLKAIEAGIDLFIFKDSTDEIINLIDSLVDAVQKGIISEARIDESVNKILSYKQKYRIISREKSDSYGFSTEELQSKIDEIALKSIKTVKSGKLLPLDKNKKIRILSPDKSFIYNYSYDKGILSKFLNLENAEEKVYPLNPDSLETEEFSSFANSGDVVIFVSYNAIFNEGQRELFKKIRKPVIEIAVGSPYDIEYFNNADTIIQSFCYKTPSLKALAIKILSE